MPSLILANSRFLHVPKTGGNWVSAVLRQFFPDVARMEKIHTTIRKAPKPEAFTFAFVRHPLTWYQSYFSYKCRKGWDAKNDWDHEVRSDSFAEFVEKAIDVSPAYYSKLLRRFVGRRGAEIDFIGRFECLSADLIHALDMAGEQFDREQVQAVPPVNQSDYGLFPAEYPEGLERRVVEVEAETLERFYSNEGVTT